MKLNELVCPSCGLKCMVDTSYTTCASCNTFFYACQSRSVDQPMQIVPPGTTIVWPQTIPPYTAPPYTEPNLGQPIWMVPIDGLPPPWGPSITCGSVVATDSTQYQVLG